MCFQAIVGLLLIIELAKYGRMWCRFLKKMNGAYDIKLYRNYILTVVAFTIPMVVPLSLIVQFGVDIYFAITD